MHRGRYTRRTLQYMVNASPISRKLEEKTRLKVILLPVEDMFGLLRNEGSLSVQPALDWDVLVAQVNLQRSRVVVLENERLGARDGGVALANDVRDLGKNIDLLDETLRNVVNNELRLGRGLVVFADAAKDEGQPLRGHVTGVVLVSV